MTNFIVRLQSDSLIRLSTKPYEAVEGRRNLFLAFLYAQLAVSDRFVAVEGGVNLATGLILQIKLRDMGIDAALGQEDGVAGNVFSILSCVAMCSRRLDAPILAWEDTKTRCVLGRRMISLGRASWKRSTRTR